jgi:hypothetical protein
VTLDRKLQIPPGESIRLLGAPKDLSLGLPASAKAKAVLLFVKSLAELEQVAPPVLAKLPPDTLFWVAYPKKGSAIPSDLHRDCGWPPMAAAGLEGVRMVAIDETWSAMRFRPVKR